jgi:deoxyribose-phosphate aldolase
LTASFESGGGTLALMRRRVTPVDRVGVDERAAVLGKRSIKAESQQAAIRMAISMVDLTTLEGQDTPGKVAQLAAKAVCPAPERPEIPSCAALCVYPARVPDARRALAGSGVAVASVATGFPAGLTAMELRLEETRRAVADGAEEVDMVISRDAYLSGDDARVIDEVEQVKDACGPAHLKVIVEADELGGYDHVRHATLLAMEGGADFVKTSTGKVGKGATPGATLVMLEAVRDYAHRHGRAVGMKAAGGVRTSKQAIHLLVLVKETVGDEWLTPDRFRIGASSLLNDLLMQYEHGASGRYQRPEDFSKE